MTGNLKGDLPRPQQKTTDGNDSFTKKPAPTLQQPDVSSTGSRSTSEISGFWDPVIKPLLETIEAKTIVEVGAAEGGNTTNLLTYYAPQSSYLHIIDPQPFFDEAALRQDFGQTFTLHQDLSLNILPQLGRFDVILLDGDHNWYTVFNELKQIEATHQDDLLTYPLIFLHDVEWPYARRDLYYNPETIPVEYRHGYAQMGMIPGQPELVPVGGLNWQLNNALYEGGEKNGVLTAVEDFLAQSKIDFKFNAISVGFGLGILITTKRWQAEAQLRQRLNELTSDHYQAYLRSWLDTDLVRRALLERGAKPYHMNLRSTLSENLLARQQIEDRPDHSKIQNPEPVLPVSSNAAENQAEASKPQKPKISIIVVLYNMRREAARTLYSLSAQYQQEINPADYEVIVVENGSTEPLEDSDLSRFGPNFKYHYLSTTSKSPVHALNLGAQMAQGEVLGLMIDGAHLLTPGVLKYAQLAFQIFTNPVVAVRYCCLGPGQQYETVHRQGYNRQAEDALLDYIEWPQNGYRLFEIGELMVPGKLGWFHPLLESNCLFIKRQVFTDLGGYEERFNLPGGGFANVDFLTRAIEYPDTTLVSVLGEATFHQVHGGTTTNISQTELLQRVEEFREDYAAIWGKQFSSSAVPTHYLGHMPPVAVSSFDMVRDREHDHLITDLRAKDKEIGRLAKACAERLELIEVLEQTAQERLEHIIHQEEVIRQQEEAIRQLDDFSRRPWPYRFLVRGLKRVKSRVRQRILNQFTPWLGVLHHYPPIPLKIPDWYTAQPTPDPAPLVSIVTPSFNQATFLERTINSVLDQNYPALEYIIQDGGSTDGTQAILDRYRSRLTSCVSMKDDGQAHAINLGFAQASGEIMAWLNSDDLLLPGTLNFIVNFFAKHPEVDVVYGHRVLIDENDGEIGRWILPPHDRKALLWADYVPQETLFWRKRIWEKIGGLDESFKFALDWELLLRFQSVGAKIVRLPRFLGAFRVHTAQKTSVGLGEVGQKEMDRLRQHYHGRPVSPAEIDRSIGFYMAKSMMYQKLYQLGVLQY